MNKHFKMLVIIGLLVPNLVACKGEVDSEGVNEELAYNLNFQEMKKEQVDLMHLNREGERHNYALNRQAKELALEAQTKEEETTEVATKASENAYLANNTITPAEETVAVQESTVEETKDFVSYLNIASTTNQLLVVSASGSRAEVSLHNKDASGNWQQILACNGYVGSAGVGETAEGMKKTPSGVYDFTFAFGNAANPGALLSYTQCDDSYYWVDDVNSAYYNKFVTTNEVTPDWTSAEHISEIAVYSYVLAFNYNASCIPGKGSAFFVHVSNGRPTAGCIAVPEENMLTIIRNVGPGCKILIDNKENIGGY